MRKLIPLAHADDAHILARAIVDTIREPLLVLSSDLEVIAGSRSFFSTFAVSEQDTIGRALFELGDGQWRIPELRHLLETVVPQTAFIENFEVERDFPNLGVRKIVLNARPLHFGRGIASAILLAMEDVTDRRRLEREKDDLQAKTAMLLNEMQHRIANSLQIIASILMLKAKSVSSDDTRSHLLDARQRIQAIAEIQRHLQPSFQHDRIEIAPYLTKLCQSLTASMVEVDHPHTLVTNAGEGSAPSSEAVSLGLITTELVINALKHAFSDGRVGNILVTFGPSGKGWQLSVADNGTGLPPVVNNHPTVGLGTTIVESLARQLDGNVRTSSSADGTCVFVTMGPLANIKQSQLSF